MNLHSESVTLGFIIIAGFFSGLLARKLSLPSLTGYMVFGIFLGESISGLVTETFLHDLSFVTDLTLGLVAFTIGTELAIRELKHLGKGIIAIIFAETFFTFILVTGCTYLITKDIPVSLALGAVAAASAPAGTVAIIQEYRASGPLTKALYAVVGFDDGLAIIIYGFAISVAKYMLQNELGGSDISLLASMLIPLEEIVLSIITGVIAGFFFSNIVKMLNRTYDQFIILIGFVILLIGISDIYTLSPIMTNMVLGFVFVNTRRESLVKQTSATLKEIMPFIFLIFFLLAGAHIDVTILPHLGFLGSVYIILRSAGKISGAWLGSCAFKVEPVIKKWLGIGLLSQAGLAIGLAFIINNDFKRIGSEHALSAGLTVITIVTATSVIFEIIGPLCAKFALQKAGEIK